jgi:hypothetical protein
MPQQTLVPEGVVDDRLALLASWMIRSCGGKVYKDLTSRDAKWSVSKSTASCASSRLSRPTGFPLAAEQNLRSLDEKPDGRHQARARLLF